MLRMRRNLLRHNAPGETRTPNLLIRSQSVGPRTSGSTPEIRPVDTTQGPKAATGSHNNAHNTFERPDLYADSKIFLAWRFAC